MVTSNCEECEDRRRERGGKNGHLLARVASARSWYPLWYRGTMDVSITQKFTIPNVSDDASSSTTTTTTTTTTISQQTFDASNVTPATLGLDAGSSPTKAEPGSYVYTGMHDHGPYPPPKEGGLMALLIGCADTARKESDKLLTDVIEEEKKLKGCGGSRKRSTDGTKKGS